MGFCSPKMSFVLRSVGGKGGRSFCRCLSTMGKPGEAFLDEVTLPLSDLHPSGWC